MVAPTLVKITRYNPGPLGDTTTPFVGRVLLQPSILRHIDGETPPDYIVTTHQFGVTFGAALMNGDIVVQPATPGVAWVELEPTDYGPYADLWYWTFTFTPSNTDCEEDSGNYFVPTTGATVDFGDLVQISPPFPEPPPDWVVQLAAEVAARINGDAALASDIADEVAARIAADADLQTQIDGIAAAEKAVSTDGSYGLPLPTDTGLEFVWTAGVLDDIRYDGNPG